MANNRILSLPEAHTDVTAVAWADSGGDETITLASLGSGAGRNGALHDFGDAAVAPEWSWAFFCQFATAPVVGQVVRVYWREAEEDGGASHPSNDDGTGDAALSSEDKLRNLLYLGSLVVDEASTSAPMAVYGSFRLRTTHGGPVIFNDTDDALSATAANNGFRMWPRPLEIE